MLARWVHVVVSPLIVLVAVSLATSQAPKGVDKGKGKGAEKGKPAAADPKGAEPTDKTPEKSAAKPDATPGGKKPESSKPDDSKLGDTKPGETKPGDKPADSTKKPGESAKSKIAGMTPEALAKLMDGNKDNQIEDKEVRATIEALEHRGNSEMPQDQTEAILAGFDKNGNGKIEKAEAEGAAAQARLLTYGGRYIKSVFDQLDTNKDGGLNRDEFAGVAKIPGTTRDGGDRRKGFGGGFGGFGGRGGPFGRADNDEDGKISLAEAALIGEVFGPKAKDGRLAPVVVDPAVAKAQKLFSSLDRDKDGKLTEDEVKLNKALRDAFRQIDEDIDGTISLEELLAHETAKKKS